MRQPAKAEARRACSARDVGERRSMASIAHQLFGCGDAVPGGHAQPVAGAAALDPEPAGHATAGGLAKIDSRVRMYCWSRIGSRSEGDRRNNAAVRGADPRSARRRS
ncbi:MAG: hypothetical protein R3E45_04265 [Rhodocyclaceae bacterium]